MLQLGIPPTPAVSSVKVKDMISEAALSDPLAKEPRARRAVYTVEEIPADGACYQNFDDLDLPVPENELAGYAVIDSAATETVCSLPALEALVKLKEAQDGKPMGLEVTQEPVKRLKFGNGEHAYASSYVLLDQMLGERRIQLGMFTLDVEGVPVLLGMKTLRRLKAIIDFDRCLVVFAAVNHHLAIGLRRSRTGHLLLNLTQDWLSQGVQLDHLGSELSLHPEILQAEIEENEALAAFTRNYCQYCDTLATEQPQQTTKQEHVLHSCRVRVLPKLSRQWTCAVRLCPHPV